MADLSKQKKHDEITKLLDEDLTPEMKQADDNITFEQQILKDPIQPNIGKVDAFGETWDINMILKGNYWGRTIYTTDEICKLFLKWTIEKQKKYLRKKNALDFDWTWILLLIFGGVGALLFIVFLLPRLGV